MKLEIYKENGKWTIKDNNGQKFKEEKGSFLNEMNIIDLSTTLNTFEGIKVSINWEATND